MKSRPARTSAVPGGEQVFDEASRVAISFRVWAALGVLSLLLAGTTFGLLMARSDLGSTRAALQRAEISLKESELRLRDAVEDKQQVIRELAAQGNRLAEFSRDEEKAKSALTAVSTDVEATQKKLAELQAQLRKLRRENAELSTLKAELALQATELEQTRMQLEQSEAELKQLRAAAEPYSAGPQGRRP